ncbi:hypothetical protein SAMN04489806_3144 [Paramicrobacterium humi]|uniref:UPF0182 protein SAMN04489806_3144 n=1 Tax=Paramicrobacterium humi TaxID=640635 RepID=A0A1H4T9Q8_9MICO|nr:UPF0182 family protein [Microbacterium humi]SEC53162.1 hypothetical protein SAMN04489806_3144 [Microbacterium humi]
MSSATARPQQPVQRRRAPLAITLIAVGVLVVLFFIFTSFYTDFLWFNQLGYTNVLTTQWIATVVMFIIGFLGMAVPVWGCLQLAYRLRPVYAKLNSQLDRYQELVEPLRRLGMWGIPVLLGLFAGFSAATRWETTLMWLNRTPTGTTDPQFGFDLSFYLFELPFYRSVLAFASAVVLLALIATAAVTFLYGSIQLIGRELRISKSARIQIAVIAGVYLLLQAVSIWLDQYVTLTQTGSLITGASYTDVNATIPTRAILAGIALVVAILFFVTAFIGRWRMPIVGTALLLVSALLIGSVYPWVVQKFQVDPNERSLEQPYIDRNIDMTREAFGVSDVKEVAYDATTDAEPGALRADAETTASIRIMDPDLISSTVTQLERFKTYYRFAPELDVDRYNIDGDVQDAVVAVREMNQEGVKADLSWVNSTLVYTHGYGLVAAYGNKRSSDGEPVFMQSGIPSTGVLGNFEPRVYFGENSPEYSIVGAPEGSKPVELDYPSGESGETYTTYDGDGGPKLDNVFNKLVYALKFQSEQIFLSDNVNSDSQILYERNPQKRVSKVAPYLTLDSDVYPSVVDGRIVWIVDGYTTSNSYPYSHTESLSSAISNNANGQSFLLDDINYMRNSVKATVDAYDGSVTLYAWDTNDPILQTWQKIFPSTLKPISAMSGDLMSHVRYPEDLFKVQRDVLQRYHVTDADKWYSDSDLWKTPADPQASEGSSALQPPYYLSMQMPGEKTPSYSLYTTFIPGGGGASSVLSGYLAANANAGSDKGTIADSYGALTLLRLPKDTTVPGPGQVQNAFNSDTAVSNLINILKQGQTEVLNGNLLTLPVGGGLLYVQPVYVKSTGETSYPLLQKVLVSFGDKIAFEDTLDEALDQLFGGDSGAQAGDTGVDNSNETPSTPPSGGDGKTENPDTNAPVDSDLSQALSDAQKAMAAKKAALEAGDWAAYGEADKQLSEAVQKALDLLKADEQK